MKELEKILIEVVKRLAEQKNTTPAETEALAKVAQVLINLLSLGL